MTHKERERESWVAWQAGCYRCVWSDGALMEGILSDFEREVQVDYVRHSRQRAESGVERNGDVGPDRGWMGKLGWRQRTVAGREGNGAIKIHLVQQSRISNMFLG